MKRNYLLILLLYLFACEENDSGALNPIGSNIKIETREVLEAGARRLTFYCATEKIYECSNYQISTETKSDEGSYNILFKSVEIGPICFTSLGPAVSFIDLGEIPGGNYSLIVRNGALLSKGKLVVSKGEIVLDFPKLNGIEIISPVTRRVPENTYWGTIGYSTQASATLVNDFIQTLSDNGAVFAKQVPGNYFYYKIDANGDIVVDVENSGYSFTTGLIFQYHNDEADLAALVQTEGSKLRDKLVIDITSLSGTQITNLQE